MTKPDHDYTKAERQRRFRDRKKAEGLQEVRERVPPDLVHILKAIAAEMRDPDESEYWTRFLTDRPRWREPG